MQIYVTLFYPCTSSPVASVRILPTQILVQSYAQWVGAAGQGVLREVASGHGPNPHGHQEQWRQEADVEQRAENLTFRAVPVRRSR